MSARQLTLGGVRPIDGSGVTHAFSLPVEDLLTHALVFGGTGSGKTGLLLVLVEEALRAQIPTLLIDVKGDLPNLQLTFPNLAGSDFEPWVDESLAAQRGITSEDLASKLAEDWRSRLSDWGLTAAHVAEQRAHMHVRILTPGSSAGEALNVFSTLDVPSPLWQTDIEAAREALSAAVSLLLRLLGREADPARSREHVLLSVLAEARLKQGLSANVQALLIDVQQPPLTTVGAMPLADFMSKRERTNLAQGLNTLLASPSFEAWHSGGTLDVAQWLQRPAPGEPACATIISVAHLDDAERLLVLSVVLEQVLAWMRTQSGSALLRALLVFDELYGFVPPHPASPATKRPLVALIKQARAYGLGLVLATQNPMDLDYRALSNAGVWCIGRLATDADRQRVVEALAQSDSASAGAASLSETLKALAARWFVLRNVYQQPSTVLLHSRTTYCWLRGPMARGDLKKFSGLGRTQLSLRR